jgi:dihydrofolate reductase
MRKHALIKALRIICLYKAGTGLIDEYKFLVHPIIMGSGKRFFKDGMGMTRLKLIESKTLSLGVVVLTYQLDRKESK